MQTHLPCNPSNALAVDEMLVPNNVYLIHPEHAPFPPGASLCRKESCLRVVHFQMAEGRNAHEAVRSVETCWKEGRRYAVDCDLKSFFDSVNVDVVMRRVAAKVSDRQVLRLVWRYLRAGVMESGQWKPTEMGVPQGCPLSPLPVKIVLHDLDMELEKRGHKVVRYADDFLVLVRSERVGQRVMASLTRSLDMKLRLTVNPQNDMVRHTLALSTALTRRWQTHSRGCQRYGRGFCWPPISSWSPSMI